MKCPHCDSWKIKENKELTIAEWISVIKQINQWLGPVPVYVAGGEPLVKKGIGELLDFISQQNPLFLMTNGQSGKDIFLPQVDSGHENLLVSLYSLDSATHDSIRQTPGSHRKAMECIDELIKRREKKKGTMKINVAFLVTSRNYREMPEFVDYFSKRGVHTSFLALRDNPLDNFMSDSVSYDDQWYRNNPLWVDDISGFTEVINKVIEQKHSGLLVNTYENILLHYIDYFRSPHSVVEKTCYIPALNFVVGPAGDVTICYYSGCVGNVLESSPKEIWKSLRRKNEIKRLKSCTNYCRIHSSFNFLNWKEKVRGLKSQQSDFY
ncbi:MAG: radical SAM protein [Deltaproteobacteria bacterium]|nr:radical SAM protein [Deltaproteobacteria bacterium]